MRVLGFMTIHYGVEYLECSLKSIVNSVDKMVVAYSRNPSHGHSTSVSCPDKESDILNICQKVLGDKLIWVAKDSFDNESQHRAVKYEFAFGFDLVLSIDADEVFKEDEIKPALEFAYNNPERYYGINGYINLWRSFSYACYDGFRPIRIEKVMANNTLQNLNCPLTIWHFSTCQSQPLMNYKYKVFGHASEVRDNWLEDIYYSWTPSNQFDDVHVVSLKLWNPVPYDKNLMPEYLKNHPNFNQNIV